MIEAAGATRSLVTRISPAAAAACTLAAMDRHAGEVAPPLDLAFARIRLACGFSRVRRREPAMYV
jgi:hypothetical protein